MARYERGLEKLGEIDGQAGAEAIEALKDTAPDFADYLIEFAFGGIYSRSGLIISRVKLLRLRFLQL